MRTEAAPTTAREKVSRVHPINRIQLKSQNPHSPSRSRDRRPIHPLEDLRRGPSARPQGRRQLSRRAALTRDLGGSSREFVGSRRSYSLK